MGAPTTAVVPPPALPATVGHIETFVQTLVADLEPEEAPGAVGRPRVLPALAFGGGLLVWVLRGFTHQPTRWRLRSFHSLWSYPRFPRSDQAVYTRLAHGGTAALERLFAQVTAVLAERLTPYTAPDFAPFATAVVALDETTLAPVARTLPALRGVAAEATVRLPGKVAGGVTCAASSGAGHPPPTSTRTSRWRRVPCSPTSPPARFSWPTLATSASPWRAELPADGYHGLSRRRAGTSYTVRHPYHQQDETFDGLIWRDAHRADRAAHAVRLAQHRHGPTLHRSRTNVLAPAVLPLPAVTRRYARRWDIELACKTVKQPLRLGLLGSATGEGVLQQVGAVLIISQMLQALQLEIAGRAGGGPVRGLAGAARAGSAPLRRRRP